MSCHEKSNLVGVEFVVEGQRLHNEAELNAFCICFFSLWRQAELHRFPSDVETLKQTIIIFEKRKNKSKEIKVAGLLLLLSGVGFKVLEFKCFDKVFFCNNVFLTFGNALLY